MKLYVGDLVASASSKLLLSSGCNMYDIAVVTQVEPLILVSEEGDMLWREIEVKQLKVVGTASSDELFTCICRMNRDLQQDAIIERNQELTKQLFKQASENVANNDLEGFGRAVELLIKQRACTT